MYDVMHPFVLFSYIIAQMYSMAASVSMNMDVAAIPTMDLALKEMAVESGVRVSYLESVDEQLDMVMGMATEAPVSVDDGSPIATSFPIFEGLMGGLGADLRRD